MIALDSNTINNFLLLAIGTVTAYTAWRGRKAHENQEKNLKKIAEVSFKQDKIYELVNHPMGVALSALASSLEQIARMTKSEDDILAAVNARKNSKDHDARQAEADSLRAKNQEYKEKIIKDFLNGEK